MSPTQLPRAMDRASFGSTDLFVANRSFAELTAIEADLLLPACAGAPADPTDDDPVVLADHIDSTIPEYRTQCLQRVATSRASSGCARSDSALRRMDC